MLSSESSDALEHETNSLNLVRPHGSCQERVHVDRVERVAFRVCQHDAFLRDLPQLIFDRNFFLLMKGIHLESIFPDRSRRKSKLVKIKDIFGVILFS